ncbi:hypothetical protein P3S68_000086 [Capsicum galapagoense]
MFKIVRETHKLPFVRVWIPVLILKWTTMAFTWASTSMPSLQDISKLQPLQKDDQGVVGKAFSSDNKLCYCKNITEFSIIEYPLVHYARWCGLNTSFAIF